MTFELDIAIRKVNTHPSNENTASRHSSVIVFIETLTDRYEVGNSDG